LRFLDFSIETFSIEIFGF